MRISDWSSDVCSSDLRLFKGVFPIRSDTYQRVDVPAAYVAGAGDLDAVTNLLLELPGIGAATNKGWGAIGTIDVLPIDEDKLLSCPEAADWYGICSPAGLMRAIPDELWDELPEPLKPASDRT